MAYVINQSRAARAVARVRLDERATYPIASRSVSTNSARFAYKTKPRSPYRHGLLQDSYSHIVQFVFEVDVASERIPPP